MWTPGSGGGGGGEGGSGDVVGPASSGDTAIARYDGATGKLLQDSSATVDDNGAIRCTRRVSLFVDDDDAVLDRACYANNAAAGLRTINLPTAVLGREFMFAVNAAQSLVIRAAGTDVIYLGAVPTLGGGTLTSNTVGSVVLLTCTLAGRWTSLAAGTWTPA
jgi:hypothetical protein